MNRLLAGLLIASLSATALAVSLNIDPNQSGSILLGTNQAAPTQIFTKDQGATKTCVINTSTRTVFLVGYSTTSALSISTFSAVSPSVSTGSFFLQGTLVGPTTVQAQTFCFDGVNDAFQGPVWGISDGTGAIIQRIRTH